MSTVPRTAATVEDLYRIEGKAELIGGTIVRFPPAGQAPGRAAGRISRSVSEYAEMIDRGEAFTGTIAFVVPELSSGRRTFSPDASYFTGPFPKNPMRFPEGAPTFTVEVRSEGDSGPAAEREMAAKRADYFEAGTAVVWDVDPVAECVHVYRATDPETPVTFRGLEEADAEPAVPGWRLLIPRIFG